MEREDKDQSNIVYVIDTDTYLHQIDLIENCPILSNVIVFQTILEELREKLIFLSPYLTENLEIRRFLRL